MPVFHELQLFLQKIGFIDFTIVDILSPRSYRLQKMLSAIYNYKLFRESAFKQFELLSKNAVRYISHKPSRMARNLFLAW